MTKLATIEIAKQNQHFSIAHFTVFSKTSRERLHGHNIRVGVSITGEVDNNGLCFDYAIVKQKVLQLCQQYDEYTLIAEQSPYLQISQDDDFYYVKHNKISMPLLKSDTLLLPIQNITIEALSQYLLDEIMSDANMAQELKIYRFEMRVSSGTDQWASSVWKRSG